MAPSSPDPTSAGYPGKLLAGRYRVERTLGMGGMGIVLAVIDETTNEPLALKLLLDGEDEGHVTRFFREAKATMRLTSDHVVRVLDVGTLPDDGLPYMVMERLDGATLKAASLATRLDEQTVANYTLQACEGLAHAHAAGIVHRDIKPSNLFLVPRGGALVLKVLDFGISKQSKLSDWERTATVTGTDMLLGSPHFISPEQLKNAKTVDERGDVWSMGVVIYNALSREFPFNGESLADLLIQILQKKIVLPKALSPAMRDVVSRCLTRDRNARFQDVGQLATALAPLASPEWAALAPRIVAIVGDSASRHHVPTGTPSEDDLEQLISEPPPSRTRPMGHNPLAEPITSVPKTERLRAGDVADMAPAAYRAPPSIVPGSQPGLAPPSSVSTANGSLFPSGSGTTAGHAIPPVTAKSSGGKTALAIVAAFVVIALAGGGVAFVKRTRHAGDATGGGATSASAGESASANANANANANASASANASANANANASATASAAPAASAAPTASTAPAASAAPAASSGKKGATKPVRGGAAPATSKSELYENPYK